jgi:hypothetical protein
MLMALVSVTAYVSRGGRLANRLNMYRGVHAPRRLSRLVRCVGDMAYASGAEKLAL